MTTSDSIQLGILVTQIIIALATVIGGILAILGYFRIIKETNRNAKERQEAIDAAAQRFEQLGQNLVAREQKRANINKLALGALAICSLVFLFLNRFRIVDRDKSD